jgi:hypothetical protein
MLGKRRLLWWLLGVGASIFLTLIGLSLYVLRPERIRAMAEAGLARHLNLDPAIEEIEVSFWPRWRIEGQGLTLRVPNRPDLPAFISITHFSMNVGPLSMLRKHVKTVHADGLRISVPPGDVRAGMASASNGGSRPEVIVDHFLTHDAELRFVSSKAGKEPLTFQIHELAVDAVGFDSEMPFAATLTNPIPRGLVKAHGHIGPWLASDGAHTSVSGDYVFSDANLSTINGIGGILQSSGTFSGDLRTIDVTGSATVPDFSLDLGGRPAPLQCDYNVIVDGTDGTTVLKRVDAMLVGTRMAVTGAIRNLEGPGRHDVAMTVRVDNGRVEDLLALAIDTSKPVMIGDITLAATLSLPPGPSRVRNRLGLAGTFGLSRTSFTDEDVSRRLQEMSRRSQGKSEDDQMDRVLTNLSGKFKLKTGVMGLEQLRFQVPGAEVSLDGTYSLVDETMNLHGKLRMQATVSKAMGGFKSIFIRPFDFVFRKEGAGAVVPIKITGPRTAPKFGIEAGKIFGK